jgi:hypothetical protein
MATNIPIPQNPIGESFVWREWFQRLSNRVFGDMSDQDSNAVFITGGVIDGTAIGATTPDTGAFTTLSATTPVALTSGGTGSNTASGAFSGAFGCGITASAACTFYSNNFCATSCMFATAFFETSDCRLKNVHNTFSAYDGINFSQFSWKTDDTNKSCYGYIAQEVEKVLPNAVHNNVEGYKQVDYNQVNTYKLSKLEDRIAKLEAIIKKYEA